MGPSTDNRRILIVDDNRSIHEAFEKILAAPRSDTGELEALEAQMFGAEITAPASAVFDLTFASQGQEAVDRVFDADREGKPYALAFVDMRMPPGWDGLETIERLWQVDPDLQVVICSAYSDYTWADLARRLGGRSSLLIIKKPFDPIEVIQSAHALTAKWSLALTSTTWSARSRAGPRTSYVPTRCSPSRSASAIARSRSSGWPSGSRPSVSSPPASHTRSVRRSSTSATTSGSCARAASVSSRIPRGCATAT